MKLQVACEQFLLDIGSRSAYGTIQLRKRMCQHLVERLGERDVEEITPFEMRAFFTKLAGERQWKPASAHQMLVVLKVIFNWFVTEELISANPCRNMRPSAFKPDHHPVMTAAEMQIFLTTPIRHYDVLNEMRRSRDKTILYLAAYAGLRRSEVCALDLKDIDLGANRIYVHGKRKKNMWQPIPEILANQLYDYLLIRMRPCWRCDNQALFFGSRRERISGRITNYIIKRHLQTCSLPSKYCFHSLRHAYATTLMRNGVDMRRIQELLRHENIQTTLSIYMHPDEQDLRDAVAKLSY